MQPARSTFWRFVLFATLVFVLLAAWNLVDLAGRLSVDIPARPSWVVVMTSLGLSAALLACGIAAGYSNFRERLWSFLELPESFGLPPGLFMLCVGLGGFTVVTLFSGFQKLLGGETWVRVFVFWLFGLMGMWGLRVFRKGTPWLMALLSSLIAQATIHLLVAYWPQATSYPFSMGWSETSRYYFPSLFLSEEIYGRAYPLPILHPTLHLLLAPPYLLDAPLWGHRLWQVVIRYLLLAAVVPAVLRRVSIPDRGMRWLVGLWIFLYLFMVPVYFHLTIPVILVLWGFSLHNDRKTWFVILLASAWCGWSRVNWYPMPAIIAATLYVLETPIRGQSLWQYVRKPVVWGVAGVLTAFGFQRLYIAISGVANSGYFYTSVASDLLWYRLFPNATYPPGIVLAAFLSSLAVWVGLYAVLRVRPSVLHPVRLFLLLTALTVLFAGGILVSLKIGGGADLHNMDAYFVLLVLIFLYLVFGRHACETSVSAQPVSLHWALVVVLVIVPVWSQVQFNIHFPAYDRQKTDQVLQILQAQVDDVNTRGGEVLFITQRHLISMGMLHGVTLIPEYEREDLMEMAMADNFEYLSGFRRDMENQRFALIVVDPLRFFKMTNRRSFAEENNVWVSQVVKFVLCNYQEVAVFPADDIALYVPQVGERQCP